MSLKDQVIELINTAKLQDKQGKLDLLAQVTETVFHRDTSLLPEFYPILLEFETDRIADVRKWVVNTIETACKADASYLPQSIPVLQRLIGDDSLVVIKRVLQCYTTLFSRIVDYIVSLPPSQDTIDLWKKTLELATKLLGLMDLDDKQHVALVSQSYSFAQALVLAFTSNKLPPDHPFIVPDQLRQEAVKVFERLVQKLPQQMNASSATALINLLSNVAKQRPAFVEPVVVALVDLYSNLPDLSDTQKKSVVHTLRSVLTTLQRNITNNSRLTELISDTLRRGGSGSGSGGGAKRSFSELPPDSAEEPDDKSAKRTKFDVLPPESGNATVMPGLTAQPSVSVPANFVSPTNIPIDMNTFLPQLSTQLTLPSLVTICQLPHQIVIDLVIENLLHMPAPPTIQQTTTQPPAVAPVATPPTQATVATPAAPSEIVESQPSASTIVSAIKRISETLGSIYSRSAAGKATAGPFIGDAILARLASLAPELDSQTIDTVFAFIVEQLSKGTAASAHAKSVLLYWLYRLYDRDLQIITSSEMDTDSKPKPPLYYPVLLERTLKMLKENFETFGLYSAQILFELPNITDQVLQLLRSCCSDRARQKLAYIILKDLAIYKPPLREACLEIILDFVQHPDEPLRLAALRTSTELFMVPQIAPRILSHATMLMRSLLTVRVKQPPSSDAETQVKKEETNESVTYTEELSEDEIQRRLLLYFALCSKQHDLLVNVVDMYVQCETKEVRQAIKQNIPALVTAIGAQSSVLLNIITNFPNGAEELILLFLPHLAVGKPSPELVNAVVTVYKERTRDARFLIPILFGLSSDELIGFLPDLVSLSSPILKAVIHRLLQPGSPITPSTLLVQLHLLDPSAVSLKKIIEAIQLCFDEAKVVVKQDVLTVVLQELMNRNPVPPLFMRTVIMTAGRLPAMLSTIKNILSRLIQREIWNDARLWEGVIKFFKMRDADFFVPLLLLLPISQFEAVIKNNSDIKEKTLKYCAANPNVHIPPHYLQVLEAVAE